VPAVNPVTATEFWYSFTVPTVIGAPELVAIAELAVQLPGGPYSTTPVYWALVAQLTCTDVWVRSVRYGALVSTELAPESAADAEALVTARVAAMSTAGVARNSETRRIRWNIFPPNWSF
jgi:hypothetical protein